MNLSSNRINPNNASANRPGISKSTQKNVGGLSNYGSSSPVKSLTEGQIIKGEITDLRNNEVIVTMEDNTCVAAHLKNGSWLAIGETAAFRVSDLSANGITLEAIPKKDMSFADSTIIKALEEAGLPKTEKNQSIVFALMQNKLPIHKAEIMKIIQQSSLFKDIRVSTLVLMNKYNIPLTQTNAAQFELYQKKEHSLLNHIDHLAESLPELLDDVAHTNADKELPLLGSRLLSIVLSDEPLNPQKSPEFNAINLNNAFSNQSATTVSYETNAEPALQETVDTLTPNNLKFASTSITGDTPIGFLPESNRIELIDILENFSLPEDLKMQILDGTAPLHQVMKAIYENMQSAIEIDNQNLQEAGIEANVTWDKNGTILMKQNDVLFSKEELLDPVTKKPLDILLRIDTFSNPVINTLQEHFEALQMQQHTIGSQFNLMERCELSTLLKDFPISEKLKENIFMGEANTTELLHVLKNVLSFTPEEAVQDLFQSNYFKSMLKETITKSFLLTPDLLQKNGAVLEYYDKMYEHLSELEELLQNHAQTQQKDAVSQLIQNAGKEEQKQIANMKDNLDFMKTLNSMFTYLQLPMKLRNQNVHGDLYVYTKKKELTKNQKNVRVLLHLDMAYLGPLDIHIELSNRHVNSKFYTSDKEGEKLISTNIELLEMALLEKGYSFSAEVIKQTKKIDIVKDFIAQDSKTIAPMRYSFDIRA